MPKISTRTHGYLDYTIGLLLIVAPWLLGFADWPEASTVIPVVMGTTIIVYSLCTKYELGIAWIIPMRVHLMLDFVGGLFLAASPWLFNFKSDVYVPHLLVGLIEIATVLMTRSTQGQVSQPHYETQPHLTSR